MAQPPTNADGGSSTDRETDGGGFRADCTECGALDASTKYELFAERDHDAEQHEHETGHDVVRTPASPEFLTDGGVDCHEPNPTADADLPRTNLPEIRFVDRFETGDDVFYALREENGVRLYRVTGETTIARSLLAYDAVIHQGDGNPSITTPSYHERYETIELYHHMAGREASIRADRILDVPVITLAEVDRV